MTITQEPQIMDSAAARPEAFFPNDEHQYNIFFDFDRQSLVIVAQVCL